MYSFDEGDEMQATPSEGWRVAVASMSLASWPHCNSRPLRRRWWTCRWVVKTRVEALEGAGEL